MVLANTKKKKYFWAIIWSPGCTMTRQFKNSWLAHQVKQFWWRYQNLPFPLKFQHYNLTLKRVISAKTMLVTSRKFHNPKTNPKQIVDKFPAGRYHNPKNVTKQIVKTIFISKWKKFSVTIDIQNYTYRGLLGGMDL